MRKLQLTDRTIITWAKNPKLCAIVPGLSVLTNTKPCKCGARKPEARNLNFIKDVIATLSSDSITNIKAIVGVDLLGVYTTINGKRTYKEI